MGPAEECAEVLTTDVIVAVNGKSLIGMSFDDACDAIADEAWPRILVFMHQIPIPQLRPLARRALNVLLRKMSAEEKSPEHTTASTQGPHLA